MRLGGLVMKLTKLGNYIEISELRNTEDRYGEDAVVGLSTQKMMIKTKANLTGVKLTSYKLLLPGHFAYVPDTSRRGDKMSLAFNDTDDTYLVSSISVVFYVKENPDLDAEYLFMYFNRPEFDRYARFNSWGSARETFSWDEMCDIELELPSLEIQKKYVAIYKAMLLNQKSYERGLEDLKLVCDGYIEELRRKYPCEEIRPYIAEINDRNSDLKLTNVQGVNSTSSFGDTKADTKGLDFRNYKVIKHNQFAYNPSRINLGSIALLRDEDCIVSPMYIVFDVINKEKLLPEYLMMWYGRSEFQRSTLFYATGSVRDTFSFDVMQEVRIPIPDIGIQQDIVDIYNAYIMRKDINEKLKAQIKDLCPILIKGSLEEVHS